MMNFKIDKKNILLISVAGGALFLIFLAFSLCMPLISAISKADKERKQHHEDTLEARKLLASKDKKKSAVKLIPKSKIPVVIDALTLLGGKYDVDIVSLRPSDGTTKKKKSALYDQAFFDVEASAMFKDMGLFLTELRKMPEGVVDVISFRLTAEELSPGRVSAKFTIMLFISKEKNNE
jgi:hypothetical protein